jgi:hypothetical protein
MKRLNVWLLGLSIVVPAMLAFSAGGDTRGGDRQFTTTQILAFVQWTADQQQKRAALRSAFAAQVKPLHDQIRQIELQIRAIDLQFEQNESALLTPDQIAAAQALLQQLEARRAEERRLAEERHLAEIEFRADERIHHGSTTRPSGTTDVVRRNDDRHLTMEERRMEAERRAEERRHEEHNTAGKTTGITPQTREERQQERERLHQEIERMNQRLSELREEKEEKESGKTAVPAPKK